MNQSFFSVMHLASKKPWEVPDLVPTFAERLRFRMPLRSSIVDKGARRTAAATRQVSAQRFEAGFVAKPGHIRTTLPTGILKLYSRPASEAPAEPSGRTPGTNEPSVITKGNHPDHVETEPDRTEFARNP
jgi:hypothetical protein